MNKCRFFKILSSYIDNQLSEKEKNRLESHLQTCSLCQEELKGLKRLSLKLKDWPAPELNPGLEDRIRNEIVQWELEKGRPTMKRKTWLILVPSSALAGILVILFLVAQGQISSRTMGGKNSDISKHTSVPIDVGGRKFEFSGGQKYSSSMDEMTSRSRIMYGSLKPALNSATKHKESFDVPGNRAISKSDHLLGQAMSGQSIGYESYALGWDTKTESQNESPLKMYAQNNIVNGGLSVAAIQPQSPTDGSVIVIQPTLPAYGDGDKVIRTADVQIEVENGKDTYKKAMEICQEAKGYLSSSNFYKDNAGRESGTIIMRIPKDKFLEVLEKLGTLGKVQNSATNSQDVGQEYAYYKAQLDAEMVVYNKILEALQKKQNTISDSLRLESELTPILVNVQNLKNQIEALNNAIAFTTINVKFYEAAVSTKVLKDTQEEINKGMLKTKINTIKFFADNFGLVTLLAILLVVAILAVALLSLVIKRVIKRE